jgi:hypothetical protein
MSICLEPPHHKSHTASIFLDESPLIIFTASSSGITAKVSLFLQAPRKRHPLFSLIIFLPKTFSQFGILTHLSPDIRRRRRFALMGFKFMCVFMGRAKEPSTCSLLTPGVSHSMSKGHANDPRLLLSERTSPRDAKAHQRCYYRLVAHLARRQRALH